MIKSIKIYNRFKMDNFFITQGPNFPFDYWYLISIYGENNTYLTDISRAVLAKIGMQKGLSLDFWDLTEKTHERVLKKFPDSTLFSESQSILIIDFLEQAQQDTTDSVLVVHCNAGISRSGAVGTFACDYCGLNYQEFMKENPYIMANPYVLRMLRRVSGMIPDFGSHDGIDHTEVEKGTIVLTSSIKNDK